MKPWLGLLFILANALSSNIRLKKTALMKKDQIIFASNFNITNIIVPFENSHYLPLDLKDMPSIFFTISDPSLKGGSCIYVLEGYASYEVLEGGRDSTTDYGADTTIYFGSNRGIYTYVPNSLTAQKFGLFHDDIIQIQKAKDVDEIYILNHRKNLYKIENNGTKKSRILDVPCALEFVLDTSNNIYYLDCEDGMPRIQRTDGSNIVLVTTLLENDVEKIKLIRPAFIMEESIILLGDNNIYFLYSNGTCEKIDFKLDEVPSAFSVDSALYIVAAVDGKIYEFNVMDMLLGSMFGFTSDWPSDVAKIVLAFVQTTKKHLNLPGTMNENNLVQEKLLN